MICFGKSRPSFAALLRELSFRTLGSLSYQSWIIITSSNSGILLQLRIKLSSVFYLKFMRFSKPSSHLPRSFLRNYSASSCLAQRIRAVSVSRSGLLSAAPCLIARQFGSLSSQLFVFHVLGLSCAPSRGVLTASFASKPSMFSSIRLFRLFACILRWFARTVSWPHLRLVSLFLFLRVIFAPLRVQNDTPAKFASGKNFKCCCFDLFLNSMIFVRQRFLWDRRLAASCLEIVILFGRTNLFQSFDLLGR